MSRNVAVLSAVSLAQDAASELLYPLLPILLTAVLGAPAAVVGVVEGVAEGAAAFMKYASGRLSDRTGRKPWVAAGYSLAALGKVVVAAATAWPVVLLGRVVDRTGKGIRSPPRDALLADGVEPGQLGRVFGFHRAADTLGAVIGPLIGLAILAVTGGNLRLALWVAVIPAALSAALVLLVREAAATTKPIQSTPSPPVNDGVTARGGPLPAQFTRVAIVLTLIALVNFPDVLILLRLSEVGFSTTGVVAAYAAYNLVYALVSYPAGALADRLPRPKVYAMGLLCFAVGYAGLGLTRNTAVMVALLCVYGGFNAFTDGVGKAWISSLVAPAVRGHAQGVFQGLMGGAVLLAGLWAGLAWNLGSGDGTVPLLVAGCAAAIAAPALWLWGARQG